MSEAETPNNQSSLPDNAPLTPANLPEESAPMITPNELNNLIRQIQQQRQHNTELLNRVVQLETQLGNAQKSLQEHELRSPATETLLAQRTAELNTVQEHNARLLRELELSHSSAQRQQILVETLTEQLETNQQQVAQLERDCARLQQRYSEQATQLAQAEKNVRDLQMRLYRQQRYTLQFKNALEKCMSMQEGSLEDTPRSISPKAESKVHPFTPKITAIQPWSGASHLEQPRLEIVSQEDIPDSSGSVTDSFAAGLSGIPNDSEAVPQASAANLLEWSPDEEVSEAEPPVQESWSSPTPFIEITSTAVAEEDDSPATAETVENKRPEPLLQGSNWPSPVVYPLRPQKKIKSLAAIDLPTFPRRQPG
ncbi:MAG: hypothetical protein F6K32_08565 [Desertifilum sp. SIO1I2]|nr:hypothetical protein [Desertifilum sp. SIO1I2]